MADDRALALDDVAFAGWRSAREVRAAAPGHDAVRLRAAYLDLLKLALCELVGTRTTSVFKSKDGQVMSRILEGDDLGIRAEGLDWPLHGLSMAGLKRLDDLQRCIESVVDDDVRGDLLEAGTWRGGASIFMRAALDVLGVDDRTVVVADSFQGFPSATDAQPDPESLAEIEFLAVGLEEVRASFARLGLEHGVEFVLGFFEATLPVMGDRAWSILRLDGDTYSATRTTLGALYPSLAVGGYVVVDDYGALEECRRAVDEYRERHAILEPLEHVDWTCVRWRRTDPKPVDRETDCPATPAPSPSRAPVRATGRHVPTLHEVLVWEQRHEQDRVIADLQARLERVEREAEALRRTPWGGPVAWLRHLAARGRR